MNALGRHEIFEIEVLSALKNAGLLNALVFGGGTMLRLCHELGRYSTDLDFWFAKKTSPAAYFKKVKKYLSQSYDLTDAHIKHYTLLLEIRSSKYPMKLKIEIRKKYRACEHEEMIAFSKNTTAQVLLKCCTLPQMMENKVEAALARGNVRDFFDIEFLIRRGVDFSVPADKLKPLKDTIRGFKKADYRVQLGSILAPQLRSYYIKNGFSFLLGKIGA